MSAPPAMARSEPGSDAATAGWESARSASPPPSSKAAARTAVGDGGGQPRSRGKKYSPMPRANIPAQPNSWMCPCAWTAATHQSPDDWPAARCKKSSIPCPKPAVRARPIAHHRNSDDGNRSRTPPFGVATGCTTSSRVIRPPDLRILGDRPILGFRRRGRRVARRW